MVSGRLVRQGEIIGKFGNFFRRERGTTYHLHFDLQVPTKYGWVFVNPYMTLVAAYERLIQRRGTEIREEVALAPHAPELTVAATLEPTSASSDAGIVVNAAANPHEMDVDSDPSERF